MDQVFHFKLGSFSATKDVHGANTHVMVVFRWLLFGKAQLIVLFCFKFQLVSTPQQLASLG